MDDGTLFGVVGTSLLLIAFVLNVSGRLPVGAVYSAMNAAGAAAAGYAAYLIGFIPFVILEGVWCLAAVVKVALIVQARRSRSAHVSNRLSGRT